jgi:hypothetical protein
MAKGVTMIGNSAYIYVNLAKRKVYDMCVGTKVFA